MAKYTRHDSRNKKRNKHKQMALNGKSDTRKVRDDEKRDFSIYDRQRQSR